MKIRTGFVSNSSTSSFCIYGSSISFDVLANYMKENKLLPEEDLEIIEGYAPYELAELFFDKIEDINNDNMTFHSVEDELYLGRNWKDIKDDETGKQLKESVDNFFKNVLKQDTKCETIEMTWRD